MENDRLNKSVGQISKEQIKNIVWQIIYEQLNVKKTDIDDSKKYRDDLAADSLDYIEIIIELENEFNINIDTKSGRKIETIGQTVDIVYNLISCKCQTSNLNINK